ncbi:sphingosine-1-phosphate phosphohydrolase-like protein [Lentithecium fluviatile CBS 122367]|uniref:Sphingosine-1-phosphate phosphohydrolase-like protein n=1 Tax=Lentithecium fluviatile CBS 122367 TaxID=1168545 RepID=A0A6G1JCF2_9PLEO|nr:sphingosine-1-phosphate phosphohydrolase-like protein [Lentithecium fluviatile CBS 122367]
MAPAHDEPRLDAGNKHQDHYARRLPPWRNAIRKTLIPIVRWETPYLAYMQEKLRTPTLDSYFAFTANLGTHTFFMVFLPILFWCGYTDVARAYAVDMCRMVHMLAAGVYWSGFLKDLLCLPRPLSPPLARITMSGSAALEYGFPSSHSTNAVSVALYAIYKLQGCRDELQPTQFMALQGLFYFYTVSIVFGRLYCGMHGFLDVVLGSILGAAIAVAQLMWGDLFDSWIFSNGYGPPLIATLVILVLVRIHPEPADDCPCFDDSVSFSGVVIGINVGAWHYAVSGFALDDPMPSTAPFSLETLGIGRTAARILLGVIVIFIWREFMKPALFKTLPPLFRILEQASLNLPRAFFLSASKYTSIPPLRDDDNVIPPASELPNMLANLAHPRKRSVSVGPQSAADAYETLAYRNRRRRESINSIDGPVPEESIWTPATSAAEKPSAPDDRLGRGKEQAPLGVGLLPTPMASRVHSYEQMMGQERGRPGSSISTTSPLLPSTNNPNPTPPPETDSDFAGEVLFSLEEAESEKREIFMRLTKPRVRYDVEVITKLIVYSGIGWLAVEGDLVLFELVGLGMGVRPW